jgi:D-alanyl-D-alanine carboxypeptidase
VALVVLAISGRAGPAAAKYSSIVIDEKTGAVLHAVNPDIRHYPASLTKMMTLYLVFEALEAKRFTLDSRIRVSRRAARQPASKLDLKPRDTISIRKIVLALAIKSANDAASAIAEAMAGTERKFSHLMSAKARALGMRNTRFRNASGLPNRRQLTTARDIAILARALRRDFPRYFGYFKVRSFKFKGQLMKNHNWLLDRYAGADGIKTGFIRASGFNLAASAERDGIRLIAVVMGTRSPRARDLHTMGLLERGFEKATQGRHRAYHYDRNIHVTRKRARINKRIPVYRAPGARGRIRLSRLTPPPRPDTLSLREQGSAARQPSAGGSTRTWSVQIGSFSRAALAELALTRVRRQLPRLLVGTRHQVRPVVTPGRTLYGAAFIGLKRGTARRICARLEARGQPCLTRAPGGGATPAFTR